MGSRPDRQMLKDLAALGLESGGVTLLPFFIHVSSIKNLNIELYTYRTGDCICLISGDTGFRCRIQEFSGADG